MKDDIETENMLPTFHYVRALVPTSMNRIGTYQTESEHVLALALYIHVSRFIAD